MNIDLGSFAFGYSVASGGNTPNWATSLGQGREHKINMDRDIIDLMNGVVYSSVSPARLSLRIGKGGRELYSGSDKDTPIVIGAAFSNVLVNDKQINDTKFILLITREQKGAHEGRLRFKYGPSNTYKTDDKTYTNEQFFRDAANQLDLADNACWFVYDISVYDQDVLKLSAVIVNRNGQEKYPDTAALKNAWNSLIPKETGRSADLSVMHDSTDRNDDSSENELTPEWFRQRAEQFPHYDEDAEAFRQEFLSKFSLEKLESLSGKELLLTMFLNPENKTNLCYCLEYSQECNEYFGSIRAGNAYKYTLFYSQKCDAWVTGTAKLPKILSEEEAISLGTEIRDFLVAGGKYLAGYLPNWDYCSIDEKLSFVTNGYSSRIWFIKYYAILYPSIFPPIYSYNAQYTVLSRLNIEPAETIIGRMYQIRQFVEECEITNVMFNKVFWSFCVPKAAVDENDEVGENQMRKCFDCPRVPRKNSTNPLNFIVYGAPGTGKTYSTVEYALAIIDNKSIDEFKRENPDREINTERYREYVKQGRIVFTTFHQNYGYEEFIQGLRPDRNAEVLSFTIVDGVFKTIADRALPDMENNYVIIVDEINRANISKVFGELITLIEDDKRWGEKNAISVTLQSGDAFAVPNNLYIIGTMNSADKSISLIDAALRRRFSFIEQRPDSSLVPDGVLRKLFNSINSSLSEELESTDLLIGHSYFMNKTETDLCSVMNGSIIPLLYEYLYDDRKKVMRILNKAIEASGAKLESVDNKTSRLSVIEKAGE